MSREANPHSHHSLKSSISFILAIWVIQTLIACPSSASVPVKVGIFQDEPIAYLNQQGRPAGVFPEILNVIAEEEDWRLEYVPCMEKACLDKKDKTSIHYPVLERSLSPAKPVVSSDLLLTNEEFAWLAAHPEISIAINQAWPPMDYIDTEGTPQGIGVGFIKALNTRLNGRLKIVPLPWVEMVEGVKEKRIDALLDITRDRTESPSSILQSRTLRFPTALSRRKTGRITRVSPVWKERRWAWKAVSTLRGFFRRNTPASR